MVSLFHAAARRASGECFVHRAQLIAVVKQWPALSVTVSDQWPLLKSERVVSGLWPDHWPLIIMTIKLTLSLSLALGAAMLAQPQTQDKSQEQIGYKSISDAEQKKTLL